MIAGLDQACYMFGMPQAVTAYVTIQPAAALVDAFFHLVFGYPNMRAVWRWASPA